MSPAAGTELLQRNLVGLQFAVLGRGVVATFAGIASQSDYVTHF
jgi:hypothetical protein